MFTNVLFFQIHINYRIVKSMVNFPNFSSNIIWIAFYEHTEYCQYNYDKRQFNSFHFLVGTYKIYYTVHKNVNE